jgi:hypothetical protein
MAKAIVMYVVPQKTGKVPGRASVVKSVNESNESCSGCLWPKNIKGMIDGIFDLHSNQINENFAAKGPGFLATF